ncbi:MAG: hypothetical protein SR3Q1_02235 [Quinella sp. 3Q1]|nr:hypothetical protein [Quinella sp. 3Q1]MBR6888641.1 hypothetical protein [Selenomonadaceae bacterium]
MKKILAVAAMVAFILVAAYPAVIQAAGNFSNWKCSQCGMERHMAGQKPPSASGCKVSNDGKHIWFRN